MTIKDLSALTGYSVGTISRVMNNQPNVSEKAKAAILAAAKQHNFQLNTNAQQLRQQKPTSLLVMFKGASNELFASLVEQIQAQSPYPLQVEHLDEDENEVARAARLCRERKPVAVLFLGGHLRNFRSDFEQIPVPAVLVTGSASDLGFPNLSSITSDDCQGARMAVEHLISLGHRKICVIGGDRILSDITRLRYTGCLDAMEEGNILFDHQQDYKTARFSYQGGYDAAKILMARCPECTAIFAMADVMAIGAIRAILDAGKRVPEDISVIGYDGLNVGQFTVPTISTVVQPGKAMAEQCLAVLRRQLEGGDPQHITLPAAVEVRESTGEVYGEDR